jgi:hypothetical protein
VDHGVDDVASADAPDEVEEVPGGADDDRLRDSQGEAQFSSPPRGHHVGFAAVSICLLLV